MHENELLRIKLKSWILSLTCHVCVKSTEKRKLKTDMASGKRNRKNGGSAFCQLLTFLPSKAVKLVAKMRVQTILPLEPKGEIRSKIPQMAYRIEP